MAKNLAQPHYYKRQEREDKNKVYVKETKEFFLKKKRA